jgi:hypothetical protein
MQKYLITVLAHPRTGTNFLMCFFQKYFPQFNVNFEIFNPQDCFMNEKYITSILTKYHMKRNPTTRSKLVSLSRNNPSVFMNELINVSEEEIIIHKIFPNHLTDSELDKVIAISNLVLVMDRNFLDVFISLEKTKLLLARKVENPWIKIDTTQVRVRVDPEKYQNELDKYREWYSGCYRKIKMFGKPLISFTYEEFHLLSLQQKIKYFQEILTNYLPPHLLQVKDNGNELLPKQDKSKTYAEKITNYAELVEIGFFRN